MNSTPTTLPLFVDTQLAGNETVELSFNADNPVLVYVYNGATDLIESRQLDVYAKGNILKLQACSLGADVLVLSGRPIEEPMVKYRNNKFSVRLFQHPSWLPSRDQAPHIGR